jgi:NADPH:quinone reductase-like Zn-dependent oxidoreductase
MKAWELNGFGLEHLKLAEKPIPKPASNEALIRIKAVSLNYRDKLLYSGLYNPALRFPCPYRKCYPARTPLKSATFEKMKLRNVLTKR